MAGRRLPVCSGRNRGLGEMTTDYSQAEQGRKIFGTSLLFFCQGLGWFGLDSPGGIFTLRALNIDDAFFRAEIAIGAIVAAYGMLEELVLQSLCQCYPSPHSAQFAALGCDCRFREFLLIGNQERKLHPRVIWMRRAGTGPTNSR
jgi:hypothetical protein